MKKSVVLLAALVTGALLRADEAPAAPAPAAPASSYSITADFTYVSTYVFRGVKVTDDSFQPSLKLAAGNAYAGIWYSEPVKKSLTNEIDFYGGYTFPIVDGWSLDVGGTYYYYPEIDPATADSGTFEGYIGLTGTVEGASVGGYVYHDFTLEATTFQGSLGYGVPINKQVSANLALTLGYVIPDHDKEYTYYGAAFTLPWKINDHATATLGVNYANSNVHDTEHDLFWVNVGYTYAF